MKIGEVKIKRSFTIPQLVLDTLSAAVLYLLFSSAANFFTMPNASASATLEEIITAEYGGSFPYFLLYIFPVVGVILWGISIFLIYKNRKKPHNIPDDKLQKWHDSYAFAVCAIRFIWLVGAFDLMCMEFELLKHQSPSQSIQIVLDVILTVVVILITRDKIKKLSLAQTEN